MGDGKRKGVVGKKKAGGRGIEIRVEFRSMDETEVYGDMTGLINTF